MYKQAAKIVFNIYQKTVVFLDLWYNERLNDTLKGLVYLGFDKKINNDNFVEGIMLWL